MKKFRLIMILALSLAMVFSMAACGGKDDKQASKNDEAKKEEKQEDKKEEKKDEKKDEKQEEKKDDNDGALSGEVTISGSTSVEPVGVACADEFMAANPGVVVTYEGIGSSGGVKNAYEKVSQIGTASRNLKEKEEAWGLKKEVIAYDGVAVIVHPDNELGELTLEQVQKIYTGEIKDWSEVGGKAGAIMVVSREDGSGTRGAFEEIVGFEDKLTQGATVSEGNGGVQQTVAGNASAIGYVSFSYLDDSVKDLLVDGGKATAEEVKAGKYPISRPFLMVYDESNMTDAAKAFIAFVLGAEGQAIVEEKGGISVLGDSDTAGGGNLSGEVTISGSTSVEPVGVACADEFMAANPGVVVTYEGIGSSGGVKNAYEKVSQIGTASRNLKEKEEAWGLKKEVIAYDGVAVVVHPDNELGELTLEQVQKIYTGEIKDWSEVGGKAGAIMVVSREDGSGTRGAFEEIVGFEDKLTQDATVAEGNGGVQQTVAGNASAIGYVSFSYLDDSIKDLLVDGGKATAEEVKAGKYPISRPFLMVYDESNMTDAAKAFVAFVLGAEGQAIVEEKGGIRVK